MIKAQTHEGDLLERRKSGVVGRDEKVVRVECTQSSLHISTILPKYLIKILKLVVGMVTYIFNLSTQEAGRSVELQVNLVYILSSRPAT